MSQEVIDIVVKTIDNEVHNFSVETSMGISNLKALIRETMSVEEGRQRLIYRGRVLSDESAIRDYNIESGHTVHMVARPANRTDSDASVNDARDNNASVATSQSGAAVPVSSILASNLRSRLAGGDLSMQNVEVDRSNMEHIRQNILTMHTIMSTMDPRNFSASTFRTGNSSENEADDGKRVAGDSADVDAKAEASYCRQYSTKISADEIINGKAGDEDIDSKMGDHCEDDVYASEVRSGSRKFFVGQWIDVKDTVNQWLEATVMNVDHESKRVFVHYNGW